MKKTPILFATHLEKTISTKDILKPHFEKTLWRIPELTLSENGLYFLAGRNGCGKSTLIRTLLGLVRPTKGHISWFGKTRITTKQIGYLPEYPVIPPTALVKNWVSWLLGKKINADYKPLSPLQNLETLSIKPFLNVPANRLSKGQLQRVQLWSALELNPMGLVLDEPFSGLDPWAKSEFSELIAKIVSEGKFVLMSSHESTMELKGLAHETWILENETLQVHKGFAIPQ